MTKSATSCFTHRKPSASLFLHDQCTQIDTVDLPASDLKIIKIIIPSSFCEIEPCRNPSLQAMRDTPILRIILRYHACRSRSWLSARLPVATQKTCSNKLAILLLAPDAWLSRNVEKTGSKRHFVARLDVCVGSDLFNRNIYIYIYIYIDIIKLGIGFTQKTEKRRKRQKQCELHCQSISISWHYSVFYTRRLCVPW